jgi:hypothetical protein
MASPLAPGTDIKSTNKVAGLLEIAQLLQAAELAVPEETRPNNVSISIDLETGTASVTATLPVSAVVSSTGTIVVAATDYIP